VATKAKSLLKPVILARLQAQDRAMLMLHRAGAAGATVDELAAWLREGRKDHLRTRLRRLDSQQLVLEHPQTGKFHRPSISWTAGAPLDRLSRRGSGESPPVALFGHTRAGLGPRDLRAHC
jgi:hypothetical protein